MARPDPSEYASYFSAYVDKVTGDDIVRVISAQSAEAPALFRSISEERSMHRYPPGKWSLKESLLHIIDAERIFTYRALRIARGDRTPLPGFEQDGYVAPSQADSRTWASLIEEFEAVRHSTLSLFRNLPQDAWARRGIASGAEMSVRALAYVVAGHLIHHKDIIRNHYA